MFRLQATPDEDVIEVARGRISVQPIHGHSVEVSAGERVVIDERGLRDRGSATQDVRALATALQPSDWQPAALDRAQEAAPAALEPGPPDSDEPGPRRKRRKRLGRKAPQAAQPALVLAEVGRLVLERNCGRAAELIRERDAATPDRDRIAQAWAMVGDCHLAARAWSRALATFTMIAREFANTPAGQNATYEQGRIALYQGKRQLARRAFGSYLERYPRGPLAADARYHECTFALEDRAYQAALECIRGYRRDYPQAKRVADSHFMEATILREGFSDCTGAVAAYERYLRRPGELAEQARQWRDHCKEGGR
jgi:outer membrane protein assembly factor BamD (BamD/ComL family)